MSPKRLSDELVGSRLRLLRELLDDLVTLQPADATMLGRDRIRRHAVERILTQMVELAASINGHIVGAQTGAAPPDYRRSFIAVAEVGVIGAELAQRLALAAGMRNLLVHEYGDIDLEIVAAAVPAAHVDFTRYVEQVASWITSQ